MTRPDHPGVIFPPPLLYLGALLLAAGLHWIRPMSIPDNPVTLPAGVVMLVAGLALNVWGAVNMMNARTAIIPYKPTVSIVSSGVFGLTRNPLYMGFNLIYIGLSFILGSGWALIMLIPLLVVMHYGVILREERYLAGKFGEPYLRYCERVRRYL